MDFEGVSVDAEASQGVASGVHSMGRELASNVHAVSAALDELASVVSRVLVASVSTLVSERVGVSQSVATHVVEAANAVSEILLVVESTDRDVASGFRA